MNVLVYCTQKPMPKVLKDLKADPLMHAQILDNLDDISEYLQTYEYDGFFFHPLKSNAPPNDVSNILRGLRKRGAALPILILEGIDLFDIKDRIAFLNAGADDVVKQEMRVEELIARFKSILRRYKGRDNTVVELNGLRVDMDQHEVYVGDVLVDLTHKEHDVLECLVRNMGRVMSKEQLLFSVYGGMDEPEIRIIDAFVWRIRRKLRRAGLKGEYLYTVWGRGYRFDRPSKTD